MPYLIDGNNLIGAIRDIDIRDPQGREKLTRRLAAYQQAKRNKVSVVFDGPPPPGTHPVTRLGGLTVVYAGPESDADARIKKMLRESDDPRGYTVVSSDRQVYSFARWIGAAAMRVLPFWSDVKNTERHAADDAEDIEGLADEDLEDWMDYFGIEDF